MHNNAEFETKGKVKVYTKRDTKAPWFESEDKETVYLFDCDFTSDDWGIFSTSFRYGWIRKEDVKYISGNIGVRAGETGLNND